MTFSCSLCSGTTMEYLGMGVLLYDLMPDFVMVHTSSCGGLLRTAATIAAASTRGQQEIAGP